MESSITEYKFEGTYDQVISILTTEEKLEKKHAELLLEIFWFADSETESSEDHPNYAARPGNTYVNLTLSSVAIEFSKSVFDWFVLSNISPSDLKPYRFFYIFVKSLIAARVVIKEKDRVTYDRIYYYLKNHPKEVSFTVEDISAKGNDREAVQASLNSLKESKVLILNGDKYRIRNI